MIEAGIYDHPSHPPREGAFALVAAYIEEYFQEPVIKQLFCILHISCIAGTYLKEQAVVCFVQVFLVCTVPSAAPFYYFLFRIRGHDMFLNSGLCSKITIFFHKIRLLIMLFLFLNQPLFTDGIKEQFQGFL